MATITYPGGSGTVKMIADACESESHMSVAVVTKRVVDKGADISDHVRSENDVLSLVLWFSDTPLKSTGDDFYQGASATTKQAQFDLGRRVRKRDGNPIVVDPGSDGGFVRDVPLITSIANATGTPAGTAINLAGNIYIPPRPPTFQPQPLEEIQESVFVSVLQWSSPFKRARLVYEELLRLKNSATLLSVSTSLRDYDNMVIVGVNPTRDVTTGNVLRVALDLEQVRIVGAVTVQITQPLQTRGYKQKNKGAQPKKEAPVKQQDPKSFALKLVESGSGSTYAPDWVKGLAAQSPSSSSVESVP